MLAVAARVVLDDWCTGTWRNDFYDGLTLPMGYKMNVPLCHPTFRTKTVFNRCIPWMSPAVLTSMFCSSSTDCPGDSLADEFSSVSAFFEEVSVHPPTLPARPALCASVPLGTDLTIYFHADSPIPSQHSAALCAVLTVPCGCAPQSQWLCPSVSLGTSVSQQCSEREIHTEHFSCTQSSLQYPALHSFVRVAGLRRHCRCLVRDSRVCRHLHRHWLRLLVVHGGDLWPD